MTGTKAQFVTQFHALHVTGIEEQEIELIKIWSIVHGMASIACMKGVKSSINWNDIDERLLV